MLFSQRKGYKLSKKVAQLASMDDELRNSLWSALHLFYWANYKPKNIYPLVKGSNLDILFNSYWYSVFKRPIDDIPKYFQEAHRIVRDYFYQCEWFEVYDLIEFTAWKGPDEFEDGFIDFCNSVLDNENSAYRFVGGKVVEITSKEEVDSIDSAIHATEKMTGVSIHLKSAIDHLSDRKNPDYRNSIKESISAVEALCRHISKDPNATLGKALSIIEKNGSLHGALKKSFSALYGCTSDADGIRHAMLEESNLTSTDAKYMLTACTSFINYMLGKASELKLKF